MEIRNWFKVCLAAALMVTNVAIEQQFTTQEDGQVVASYNFSVDYSTSFGAMAAQEMH